MRVYCSASASLQCASALPQHSYRRFRHVQRRAVPRVRTPSWPHSEVVPTPLDPSGVRIVLQGSVSSRLRGERARAVAADVLRERGEGRKQRSGIEVSDNLAHCFAVLLSSMRRSVKMEPAAGMGRTVPSSSSDPAGVGSGRRTRRSIANAYQAEPNFWSQMLELSASPLSRSTQWPS